MKLKKVFCEIILILLLSFSTILSNAQNDTIKDIDGNIYTTVKIGTQIWMQQNLKVRHLNDGTPISKIGESWSEQTKLCTSTEPLYTWVYGDSTKNSTLGVLYNAFTIETSKICPTGWHVPSNEEWDKLILSVPNTTELKSDSSIFWDQNKGNNASGFTALASGKRKGIDDKTTFYVDVKTKAYWWSSTKHFLGAYYYSLDGSSNTILKDDCRKNFAMSIRCIKN